MLRLRVDDECDTGIALHRQLRRPTPGCWCHGNDVWWDEPVRTFPGWNSVRRDEHALGYARPPLGALHIALRPGSDALHLRVHDQGPRGCPSDICARRVLD